jgi:multiphosphoryl transfer protein
MSLEYTFTCPLPQGVHARPASALEDVARHFTADISILNERNGQTANAKSVLAIVGVDIRPDDRCRLIVAGAGEQAAFDALRLFLEQEFPRCDDVLPPVQAPPGEIWLPPLLKQAGATVRSGSPVVPGIGQGRAVRIGGFLVPDSIPRTGVVEVTAEIRRLDAALDRLARTYDSKLERTDDPVESDVLEAHRSVARDPEFRQRLEAAVRERGCTAAGAIAEAEAYFTAMLVATGSLLLRERALDLRDVCFQLLRQIYAEVAKDEVVRLMADSVCLADSLTPGQLLSLDRRWLKGLVLAHGGTTSHTIILARSFGIPALVGVSEAASLDAARLDGQDVIVDGYLGILVTNLTERVQRYYDMERRRLEGRRSWLRRFAGEPALTGDGLRIEVAANIASAEEAAPAFADGAEGIGVFRTEMLFVHREQAPTEAEQFEQYRRVVSEAGGRSVIIRTLDVGGDKPIPYLRLPREDNPFLGYRGVRLYPEFEAIFRDQIRALVRASAFGQLKVMIPMVSCLEEVAWARKIVAEEQARSAQSGAAFDASMEVGAMVEVPSIAFHLDRLCAELDFLSIGTNDLLQYFVAADRTNRKVSGLYNPMNPAFLRLLKKIVDDSHAQGRWVGLCGEMGGQLWCLPLLVGLGLDEISMASPGIVAAKAEVRGLSAAACRALLEQALACPTASDVERLVGQFESGRRIPLIDPELVVIDAGSQTKEEAIKEIVDRLYVTGRTESPRDVEERVWQREMVYSTGFGHGFAIPHCKTDAVRADSLALLKLKTPVEWGSLDGKPVQVLLLLTIRESDQATEHMKVLAALARRLVHEDFRRRLIEQQDPEALCRFLKQSLEA